MFDTPPHHPTSESLDHLAPFSRKLVQLIRQIPPGCVATYGDLAAAAGSPRAARQVVRLLHSSSQTYQLPWQRVINKAGRIGFSDPDNLQRQRCLLEREGVEVTGDGQVDLARYRWLPPHSEIY